MSAQTTIQPKWWQSIKQMLTGTTSTTPQRWDCSQRVTIRETDAYTVPDGARRLRVANGGAWVSHLREDFILNAGQTLHLHPDDREGVVVTAVGHQPLELEIYR
jgi:hypothetical protein